MESRQFLYVSYGFKTLFNAYNAQTYSPVMDAYLRKYKLNGAADPYEIQDRKCEYYEIDTTQYMSYTNEDLANEHGHVNHSP